MDDLIKRNDALDVLERMLYSGEYEIIAGAYSQMDEEKAYQAIKDIPAAEKKAYWRITPDGFIICSGCGEENDRETNFCPECGAKMLRE